MILSIIFYIIIALVLYFLYNQIVAPYIGLQFYKNQGIKTRFLPFMAGFAEFQQGLKEHDDIFYPMKYESKKFPGEKAIALNYGTKSMISLVQIDLIKEFSTKDSHYKKMPITLFEPLIRKDGGLIFAHGDSWKQQRKIITQSFHYELLKNNAKHVYSEVRDHFTKVKEDKIERIHVLKEMQSITAEIIGKLFFGEQLGSVLLHGKSLPIVLNDLTFDLSKTMMDPMFAILGENIYVSGLIPRYNKLKNRMVEFRGKCKELVQKRKNQSLEGQKHNDLLQSLLNQGDNLEDDTIVDNFVGIFSAGMDTTAHAITMLLYFLKQYPECMEKLNQEINDCYPKEGIPTIEDTKNMKYLDCLIKETLRHFSPAPGISPRISQEDHMIGDIKIRKGDAITAASVSNWFNSEYFDEPEKFIPERWEKVNNGTTNPFIFTPFWTGQRNCVGQHLAQLEIKIITIEFLKMFDYEFDSDFKLIMSMGSSYEPDPIMYFNLKYKEQE